MGRISTRWRRFWGVRPGELRRPITLVGRRRTMGEPRGGPHGRGWSSRHVVLSRQAGKAKREGAPLVQASEFPVTILAGAEIGESVRRRAREIVGRAARHAPRPVLHARVTLSMHHDQALERPAIAKVALDVGGHSVRAHVAAAHMTEALDLVAEQLRRSLEDLEELERNRRREIGVAPPGEWRHGSLPAARPDYFPRPPEEREVVRRKTFALSPLTPEEAVLEMRVLDYDFHLFVNADTGEENVVYRRQDGRLALAVITPTTQPRALPIGVDTAPAPVMLLDDAVELLNASGARFAFFADAQTRRGNLLYRRYDGHYGLIEPAG